ncbi:MAG: mannosyltransferase family protein [Patescibacteria group bacterium]
MLFIFSIFLLWRAFDFVIAYFSPRFLPYLGHFSYVRDLDVIKLPDFIKSFANFDGLFYIRIAENGYSQFEHAFFPLYPGLINGLTTLFGGDSLIAGLIISNLAFLLALLIFKKYLENIFNNKNIAIWTIIFIILFPTSFFFGALYTESLFLLFSVLCFYFLDKKKFIRASVFAILASLTRFIGVFLFVPILVYILNTKLKDTRNKIQAFLYTLSPFIGLAIYSVYLYFTTGNFFEFFTSQEAFSAGRSTKLILFPQVIYRYIKIFITADVNFQYFISTLEFLVFLTFFVIISIQIYLIFKKQKLNIALLSLSLFSLINLLIPTFTGTFLSIPRFALISLSFFIFLSLIKNKFIKSTIVIIFFITHIVLLAFFIQGYFIA